VEPICVVIEFPASTYYAARNRKDAPSDREIRDEELVPLIREVWVEKGKRLYGARTVWKQLRRDGVDVARCTVERLMRTEGMLGVIAWLWRGAGGRGRRSPGMSPSGLVTWWNVTSGRPRRTNCGSPT
jgi:hypothetical protein